MLTPFQFSALAAAAWSGPTATIQASASTVLAPGGHFTTYYTVCYTIGGIQFSSSPAGWSCPFAAVLGAVGAYSATIGGGWVVLARAQQAVALAESLFAGAPVPEPSAPAGAPVGGPVCAVCGEGEDLLGECACSYVPAVKQLYHVAA